MLFIFLVWTISWGLVISCDEEFTLVNCSDLRGNCKCSKRNFTLFCCNIKSEDELEKNLQGCAAMEETSVQHIHLQNVTLGYLDASLKAWRKLNQLTISAESKVKRIFGRFQGELNCINFSNVGLLEIEDKAFTSLPNLHFLNLSKNNLTNVPKVHEKTDELVIDVDERNITLDISGNAQIRCHSVIDLLDELQNLTHVVFANDNSTFCLSSQSFNWFNSTEVVPLTQLLKLRKLQLEQLCPRGPTFKCHCSAYRLHIVPGHFPTNNAQVDCSGQHLTELPPDLPPNTKLLNVSNNNITSLSHLSKRPSYRDIKEFYADNNQIKSISELEGSFFIENFSLLSLRGNNLTSIPTYILSNAFERSVLVPKVKIGGNRLNCDCNTAQVLKVWLLTNKEYIPDYEELDCAEGLGKVTSLEPNKVCIYKKEWTDYIYYIIAGEVLLLVLLISKVSYDYWVFKTTGHVPCLATKMPKLPPCDWLFESW